MDWKIIFCITVVVIVACLISYKIREERRRKYLKTKQFSSVARVSRKTKETVYLIYKGREYQFQNEKMFVLHVGDEVGVMVHKTYWKGQRKYCYLTVEDPEFT